MTVRLRFFCDEVGGVDLGAGDVVAVDAKEEMNGMGTVYNTERVTHIELTGKTGAGQTDLTAFR
jgi:hypothetical protein